MVCLALGFPVHGIPEDAEDLQPGQISYNNIEQPGDDRGADREREYPGKEMLERSCLWDVTHELHQFLTARQREYQTCCHEDDSEKHLPPFAGAEHKD